MSLDNSLYAYKWLSLIGLSLLSFTAYLDYTIVSTAIPFIQQEFKANIINLQWVMTIFLMMQSMSMIAVGKLGDIWNRRLLFYIGFIIFAIAAIGAALSPNLISLILFRALQGFSAAIIFTQSAILLPQAFPKDQQRLAIVVYTSFNGLGLAIGPLLGGIIIHYLNWRYVFWVNIPIIIIGFSLCIFTLKKSPQANIKEKFDWLGLILLAITIWSIILGTIKWGQWIYLIIGAVSLILLIIQEIRHKTPLIEIETFTNPYALISALICSSAAVYAMVYLFFDPIYFKVILKYSPALIGLVLVSMPVAQILVSVAFPYLMKRFNIIKIIIGCATLGLIGAILNSFFHNNTQIWVIIITLLCMGAVWGIANTGSITVVSEHVSPNKSSTILGTVFTIWNLAGAIFIAISSVIFHNKQINHLNHYIKQHSNTISSDMISKLKLAAKDPNHALQILHNPQKIMSTKLYEIFSDGFLNSLHYTSFCLVILVLIMLVSMLIIWIKVKKQ